MFKIKNNKKQKALALAIALQINFLNVAPVFAATDDVIQSTVDAGSVDTSTAENAHAQKVGEIEKKAEEINKTTTATLPLQEQKNATTKADLASYDVAKSDGSMITISKNLCYNKQTSECTTSYLYIKDSSGTQQTVPSYTQEYVTSDGSQITSDEVKQIATQVSTSSGDTSGYLKNAISSIAAMGRPVSATDYAMRLVALASVLNQQKIIDQASTAEKAAKDAQKTADDKSYAERNEKATKAQSQSGAVSASWTGDASPYDLLPILPTSNDQSTPITISFRHFSGKNGTLQKIEVTYFDKDTEKIETKTIQPDQVLTLEPAGKITSGTKSIKAVFYYLNNKVTTTTSAVIKYQVQELLISLINTSDSQVKAPGAIDAVVANKDITEYDDLNVIAMGLITDAEFDDKTGTCAFAMTNDSQSASVLAKSNNISKSNCVAGRYASLTNSKWQKLGDGTSYLSDQSLDANSTKTFDNASDYWNEAENSAAAYAAGSTYDPDIVEIEADKLISSKSGNIGTDYVNVGGASVPINAADGTIGFAGRSLSNDEIATMSSKAGLDVSKLSVVRDDDTGLFSLQDKSGKVVSNLDANIKTLNKSVIDYVNDVKNNGVAAFKNVVEKTMGAVSDKSPTTNSKNTTTKSSHTYGAGVMSSTV